MTPPLPTLSDEGRGVHMNTVAFQDRTTRLKQQDHAAARELAQLVAMIDSGQSARSHEDLLLADFAFRETPSRRSALPRTVAVARRRAS